MHELTIEQNVDAKDTSLVDDLEAAESPESIMLRTVMGTTMSQDSAQVVTPWLRFLWEAYRTALETLRNNTRMELLYKVNN